MSNSKKQDNSHKLLITETNSHDAHGEIRYLRQDVMRLSVMLSGIIGALGHESEKRKDYENKLLSDIEHMFNKQESYLCSLKDTSNPDKIDYLARELAHLGKLH